MAYTHHESPRVLIFSSGNPAASFLTAGLLCSQPLEFGAVFLQGTGDASPAQEVTHVLAEVGCNPRDWAAPGADTPPVPIEIGLTICVPT
jgi:hypothetical protein